MDTSDCLKGASMDHSGNALAHSRPDSNNSSAVYSSSSTATTAATGQQQRTQAQRDREFRAQQTSSNGSGVGQQQPSSNMPPRGAYRTADHKVGVFEVKN
jgi:hypothetical protein